MIDQSRTFSMNASSTDALMDISSLDRSTLTLKANHPEEGKEWKRE